MIEELLPPHTIKKYIDLRINITKPSNTMSSISVNDNVTDSNNNVNEDIQIDSTTVTKKITSTPLYGQSTIQHCGDFDALSKDALLNRKEKDEANKCPKEFVTKINDLCNSTVNNNILSDGKKIDASFRQSSPIEGGPDTSSYLKEAKSDIVDEVVQLECAAGSSATMDGLLLAHTTEQNDSDVQRFESLRNIMSLAAINENEEANNFEKSGRCIKKAEIPHNIAYDTQMNESFTSTMDNSADINNDDEQGELEYSIDSDAIVDELITHDIKQDHDWCRKNAVKGTYEWSLKLSNNNLEAAIASSKDGDIQKSKGQRSEMNGIFLPHIMCDGDKNEGVDTSSMSMERLSPASRNNIVELQDGRRVGCNNNVNEDIQIDSTTVTKKITSTPLYGQSTIQHCGDFDALSKDALLNRKEKDEANKCPQESVIKINDLCNSTVNNNILSDGKKIDASFRQSSPIEGGPDTSSDLSSKLSKSNVSHKSSWKSTSTAGVIEKLRKREEMLERFQLLLVKAKSNTFLTEPKIIKNNMINIDNCDESVYTSTDMSSLTGFGAQSRNNSIDNASRAGTEVQCRDGNGYQEITTPKEHTSSLENIKLKPQAIYVKDVSLDAPIRYLPKKKLNNYRSALQQWKARQKMASDAKGR